MTDLPTPLREEAEPAAAIEAARQHLFEALGVRLTPYNEVERHRYEGFLAGYAESARALSLAKQRAAGLEKLLLDEGVSPGRYETDGALVLPDDDYVVDGEGCYLRRHEAEAMQEDNGTLD